MYLLRLTFFLLCTANGLFPKHLGRSYCSSCISSETRFVPRTNIECSSSETSYSGKISLFPNSMANTFESRSVMSYLVVTFSRNFL